MPVTILIATPASDKPPLFYLHGIASLELSRLCTALWCPLCCIPQTALLEVGGFEGFIMQGFLSPDPVARVRTFEQPVYVALCEVLVGTLFSPSAAASDGQVELFGKPIQHPSVISLIMQLTPLGATWDVKRDILKVWCASGCACMPAVSCFHASLPRCEQTIRYASIRGRRCRR